MKQTQIVKELNTAPLLDKIQDNKRDWIQHVNRTLRNRLPRIIKTAHQQAEGPGEDH
jgi:hypothetical protein